MLVGQAPLRQKKRRVGSFGGNGHLTNQLVENMPGDAGPFFQIEQVQLKQQPQQHEGPFQMAKFSLNGIQRRSDASRPRERRSLLDHNHIREQQPHNGSIQMMYNEQRGLGGAVAAASYGERMSLIAASKPLEERGALGDISSDVLNAAPMARQYFQGSGVTSPLNQKELKVKQLERTLLGGEALMTRNYQNPVTEENKNTRPSHNGSSATQNS